MLFICSVYLWFVHRIYFHRDLFGITAGQTKTKDVRTRKHEIQFGRIASEGQPQTLA